MAQLRILFRRTLGEPDLAKSIDLHRAPTMALLLSALTSNAYGYVLWAPPATPVRATFPTMLHQGDPLPWGVENTARVHIHDGLHYGQPQIGGLTIAQVRERAKKRERVTSIFRLVQIPRTIFDNEDPKRKPRVRMTTDAMS